MLPIICATMNNKKLISDLNLVALPAFSDNYIWMLHDGHNALVVDPGDSAVVLEALKRLSLRARTP